MIPHAHRWLLGSLRPWGTRRLARVRYRCACGARRVERATSPLVVDTARWMEAKKVEAR